MGSQSDTGPLPSGDYDEATLFWRHEVLHCATLRDYATRIAQYQRERGELEHPFVEGALARLGQPAQERAAYSASCFAQADAAEARWTERVQAAGARPYPGLLYSSAWRGFDRAARMSDDGRPTASCDCSEP